MKMPQRSLFDVIACPRSPKSYGNVAGEETRASVIGSANFCCSMNDMRNDGFGWERSYGLYSNDSRYDRQNLDDLARRAFEGGYLSGNRGRGRVDEGLRWPSDRLRGFAL